MGEMREPTRGEFRAGLLRSLAVGSIFTALAIVLALAGDVSPVRAVLVPITCFIGFMVLVVLLRPIDKWASERYRKRDAEGRAKYDAYRADHPEGRGDT